MAVNVLTLRLKNVAEVQSSKYKQIRG